MMTEETAEFAPEAASLPPGHVSGAQAAAMGDAPRSRTGRDGTGSLRASRLRRGAATAAYRRVFAEPEC